jgi:glucosyl-3-phosphoglycerate synthase
MSSVSSGNDLARMKNERGHRVGVCLPALNEADTIGPICDEVDLRLRRELGLVDELLVVDCGSQDNTRAQARRHGAEVVQITDIAPDIRFGGKGEALWKSLATTDCSIIVWLDSDVANFEASWVVKLLEPLLRGEALLTKGSYRRPLLTEDSVQADGGGRVTELLARPLISALWPQLAQIRQPLAGECAGFTSLLRDLPFLSGYAVELGVLVQFANRFGIDSIRDVDLGARIHRNRPLRDLARMSFEIVQGAFSLLEAEGRTPALQLSNVLVQPGDLTETVHQVDIRLLPPRHSLAEAARERESFLAAAGE